VNRRTFLCGLTLGATVAPLGAKAQPAAGKLYRLGLLSAATAPGSSDQRAAVILVPKALRELGYVEGQNLIVERRYAGGKLDRLPGMAKELVQLGADVIFAIALAAVQAAKDATATTPIVFYGNFDPVANGLVGNLARPGGNVTGILLAPEGTLAAKKLELLKETVPQAKRIAMLVPEDPTSTRLQIREAQNAAAALGVTLNVVAVRGGDYDRAFTTMAAERPGALFVAATAYFMRDRKRIIELAAKHRLPAIYEWPEQVEDGGLMAYGTSFSVTTQRAAAYIDRIFRGATPSDLPIEQPTKFELVINLKTAAALGLTIPPSLLLRANQILE
jgi:putative tryptophan/tyrosine transport system substrate-binding protein